MKKANYFKHFNSLRDEEMVAQLIMDLGAEGYGLYILLLELLNSTETYRVKKDYKRISFLLRIPNSMDLIAQVVEGYSLFDICDQDLISSKEMDIWMEEYEQKCKTNAKNRKQGWEDKKKDLAKSEVSHTNVEGPYKNPLPIEESNNRIENKKIKKIRTDERVQGEKGDTSFFPDCIKAKNADPVVIFFEYLFFAGNNKFESVEEQRREFISYWRNSKETETAEEIEKRLNKAAFIGYNLTTDQCKTQVKNYVEKQKEKTPAGIYTEFLEQLKSEGFEPVEGLKKIAESI